LRSIADSEKQQKISEEGNREVCTKRGMRNLALENGYGRRKNKVPKKIQQQSDARGVRGGRTTAEGEFWTGTTPRSVVRESSRKEDRKPTVAKKKTQRAGEITNVGQKDSGKKACKGGGTGEDNNAPHRTGGKNSRKRTGTGGGTL